MKARSVVVELPTPASPSAGISSQRATLQEVASDGTLWVKDAGGQVLPCDWLQTPWAVTLEAGDEVLAMLPATAGRGIVIGRVGRYGQVSEAVAMQSANSLALRCGKSSIDLRADGRVVIKGEDVLVRAKGTKRIRAGSVSIN